MKMNFETSLQSGPHFFLKSLVGKYTGEVRVWFEGPDPVDVSPVTAEIRGVHGDRFAEMEYETSFQGKPVTGTAFLGTYLKTAAYQLIWMDSFHTGTSMIFFEGSMTDVTFNVRGSYPAGEQNEQTWGWRMTMEKKGGNILWKHYNITPDGQEFRAIEITLTPQS